MRFGGGFGDIFRCRGGRSPSGESTIRLAWKERYRYGRIVGDVFLGNRHINTEIVHDGFAWWYRHYVPKAKQQERAEAEARTERRGLWRDK
jgi:endonuclease YncB( thermonuclease family)